MGLADWIARFRSMHERAGRGELAPGEHAAYQSAREELARALLAAQRMQARPGQSARAALRVGRALQATVDLGEGEHKTLTLDLSIGGFGALLPRPASLGSIGRARLRLPGAVELSARVRVVGSQPNQGSARVSFAFEALSPDDAEKLERVVFDAVLDQLKAP